MFASEFHWHATILPRRRKVSEKIRLAVAAQLREPPAFKSQGVGNSTAVSLRVCLAGHCLLKLRLKFCPAICLGELGLAPDQI